MATCFAYGQTGSGKTEFILNLIATEYLGDYEHIVIICPTIELNSAYLSKKWIWNDDEVYIDELKDRDLDKTLEIYFEIFRGDKTLYVVDDCAGCRELVYRNFRKDKKSMLVELAFSGRHSGASLWVLTQKYTNVQKDIRSQAKWLALFYCKDRDSFDECLRENDVVPEEKQKDIKNFLKSRKYGKLILKTDQPTNYQVLDK